MKITPENHALWIGPEVEGRFRGLPTLIVTERATLDEIHQLNVKARNGGDNFLHIFVECGFLDTLSGNGIKDVLAFGKMVSILIPVDRLQFYAWQLEELSMDERRKVHVVTYIDVKAYGLDNVLAADDSIALFVGDHHTLYASIQNMTESMPFEYEDDKLIR